MAGDVNKELSRLLALKLQDPVSSGSEDTVRLTARARLSYIKRGLYSLFRLLRTSYPHLAEDILSSYTSYGRLRTDRSGVIGDISFILELNSVYVRAEGEEKFAKARVVSPDDWMDIKTGQNFYYKPDLSKKNFFACRINSSLEIEPAVELETVLYYLKSAGEPDFQKNDIEVSEHYWDILLNLAASEHYLDIAQLDFADSFRRHAMSELKVLLIQKEKGE